MRQNLSLLARQLLTRILAIVHQHRGRARSAAVALVIFFGLAVAFALTAGNTQKALGTATLPPAGKTVQQDSMITDTAVLAVAKPAPAKKEASTYAIGAKLEKMPILPPQKIDNETLWLARCIQSETNRPQEQELVAWVIRNRVETRYRGNDSYQEAVLDPYQFSAFNPGTSTREKFTRLSAASKEPGFQNALAIAKQVKDAPAGERPFAKTTRHFYSARSMPGGRAPAWAHGETPVQPSRPLKLEAARFRFYANVG